MDRNLALDFVRVTEAAAMASARWVGKGDKHKADEAAVRLMRKTFNMLDIEGKIVIGEGERDEAPMLFIGENVGMQGGKFKIDLAVDPLECTNSVAYGRQNAMAVLAAAPSGTLMHAPDTYMNKIAVGPDARGSIDIDASVEENLTNIATALDKQIKDLTVMVLDRERHNRLISDIRKCDARIILIPDGDVAGAIAPSIPDSGVDVLMGIGAAPEGVLAAAALNCLGGDMQARFQFRNEQEKERAKKMGVEKLNAVLFLKDLVNSKEAMFAATGVTDGPILKGVRFTSKGAITHSIVMRAKTGTTRFLETHHVFEDEPKY
ncbi:class II fructose-bisphosphatase [Candidatus Woesearchaeota archaeon]|nr:class II fructose-bisphosphatase [Candidatus Woesearchaeota archaeon]